MISWNNFCLETEEEDEVTSTGEEQDEAVGTPDEISSPMSKLIVGIGGVGRRQHDGRFCAKLQTEGRIPNEVQDR